MSQERYQFEINHPALNYIAHCPQGCGKLFAGATMEEARATAERCDHSAIPPESFSGVIYGTNTLHPVVDEVRTFGMLDRSLSEMKFIIDHPNEFDAATFQTLKHHLEDAELFVNYAKKKLEQIKSLPPTSDQRPRGF
jgi:hypothetical protein